MAVVLGNDAPDLMHAKVIGHSSSLDFLLNIILTPG